MFSVILDMRGFSSSPSPDAAVRSLSALVAGVVQGYVRDVVMIAQEAHPILSHIADDAGCEVMIGDSQLLTQAVGRVRQDYILLLRAGAVLDIHCFEDMGTEIDLKGRNCAFIIRARPHNFITRLFPQFCAAVGVLAHRGDLENATRSRDRIAQIARSLNQPISCIYHARMMR